MENIGIHQLKENCKQLDKIYLYGASVTGEGILRLLQGAGINVEAFIDSDISKYGKLFCGKKVVPVKDVPKESYVIITTSLKYHKSIIKILENEYGIFNIYFLFNEVKIVKTPSFRKGYNTECIPDYEKRYNEIKSSYKKIELYFMWADRIGEIIYRYIYMYYELLNVHDNVYRIIMPHTCGGAVVANGRLLDIIKKNINVVYGENEEFWNYIIEKHQSDIIDWEKCWKYDVYDKTKHMNWKQANLYSEKDAPAVVFSDSEIEEAEIKAKKFGINKKFICVFARDGKYLKARGKKEEEPYSYHNYRDFDISSYKLLAHYLEEKNMQLIRVGNIQNGKLSCNNVIDITGDNYDELLDLYINSKCEYWIGCNSGAMQISGLFKKKKIHINLTPIVSEHWSALYCTDKGCAYIPKLYYLEKDKRYLNIKEMIMVDISGIEPHLYYENFGIKHIENKPEDILELYKECELKSCNKWKDTEDDKILQERYNSLLEEVYDDKQGWTDEYGYSLRECMPCLPIGTSFLRKYSNLLLP